MKINKYQQTDRQTYKGERELIVPSMAAFKQTIIYNHKKKEKNIDRGQKYQNKKEMDLFLVKKVTTNAHSKNKTKKYFPFPPKNSYLI